MADSSSALLPKRNSVSSGLQPLQRFYSNKDPPEARNDQYTRPSSTAVQPNTSLNDARARALYTLSMCSAVISALEVTRLRKSRVGFAYYMAFWERLYDRTLARALSSHIGWALSKINVLFREMARQLHEITRISQDFVNLATCEYQILYTLQRMEKEVKVRRKRRRRRARNILDYMRANIEAIPVGVSEHLYDDIKRGVFGLDIHCDYHPGDPDTEARETMGLDLSAVRRHGGRLGMSPTFYQQWLEAVSNSSPSTSLWWPVFNEMTGRFDFYELLPPGGCGCDSTPYGPWMSSESFVTDEW